MAHVLPNGNSESLKQPSVKKLIARHPRLVTQTNTLVSETSIMLIRRPVVPTITKGLIKTAELPLSHKNLGARSSMIFKTIRTREHPH